MLCTQTITQGIGFMLQSETSSCKAQDIWARKRQNNVLHIKSSRQPSVNLSVHSEISVFNLSGNMPCNWSFGCSCFEINGYREIEIAGKVSISKAGDTCFHVILRYLFKTFLAVNDDFSLTVTDRVAILLSLLHYWFETIGQMLSQII